MDSSKRALVTTSWDDGHPLDLRVAERLASYGLKGTFYIPVRYAAIPRMSSHEILTLRGMSMEIGSHTMTHPRMHRLADDEVWREITESKAYLEDLLGEEVSAFCFPEGKFRRGQARLLQRAGYKVGRTTIGLRTDLEFDARLMPTSFQFWSHSRQVLLRHELLQRNLRGAWEWLTLCGAERDLLALTKVMLRNIADCGGLLHIWGHSWEIERGSLWKKLDDTLKFISEYTSVVAVTNSEVIETPRTCPAYT